MKFDKKDLKLGKIAAGKGRKAASGSVRSGGAHADKTKFNKAKERQVDRKLKRSVNEAEIITNLRLNDHQKALMTSLASRNNEPTTLVDLTAKVDDANKQNITSALQTLQKLGLVDVKTDQSIAVSQKGQQVMKDENLVDATGGLSGDAQKYQSMFKQDDEQNDASAGPGQPGMGGGGLGGDMGGGMDPGMGMGGEPGFEMGPEGEEDQSSTELPYGNAPGAGEQPDEEAQNQKSQNGMTAMKRESFSLIKQIIDDIDHKKLMERFK